MSFTQELYSWIFSGTVDTQPVPEVGNDAPSAGPLKFPRSDQKPTIVTFLRHCGCPFAEKAFRNLRDIAARNSQIKCIAVSHSDQSATDKWVEALGGAGDVEVVVDFDRLAYGAFGLGISSFLHALNPTSFKAMSTLGNSEGIWNRPTESGTRWQTAGMFAVNDVGIVKYAHKDNAASDIGDFEAALKSIS